MFNGAAKRLKLLQPCFPPAMFVYHGGEHHNLSSEETVMSELKRKLLAREFVSAPGIFDGISVRTADPMGFDALYMTGYGTVASHLGLPDAGIASYRDMVERVKVFCGCLLYTSPSPRDRG